MTRQLLIYSDPIVLSAETHRDLSVRTSANFSFARQINSVPVVLAEFERLAPEAPIVFAGEGDAAMPAVLLGFEDAQNLFVDENGNWNGSYVPAFLRRYPFVLASNGQGEGDMVLCIDRAFEGLNEQGKGERLFDSEGNRTRFLDATLQFAVDYHSQHELTRRAVARLADLNLFEPATATANLPDGRALMMSGFQKISESKLAGLEDEVLLALFRDGILALIYRHLVSLGQVQGLLRRLQLATSSKGENGASG